MSWASTLIDIATVWLYAGAVVAALFLLVGIDRIDEDSRGAYVFRPLLVPGVLLLWPLVVWRWWQLESGWDPAPTRDRPLRVAHGRVWLVLGIVIPALFVGGMLWRQSPPDGAPAIRLDKPNQ